MSERFEAIPHKQWRHKTTGETASIFSPPPWRSLAERHDWGVEQVGFTVRDNLTGVVGMSIYTQTEDEAIAAAARLNQRHGSKAAI